MYSATLKTCIVSAAAASVFAGDDDWLSFPSKRGTVFIHRECVHHIDDQEFGKDLGPCSHAPRFQNASAQVQNGVSYYSDWVAYTATTGDFGYMSSDWTVPKAPKSHGPVPGMSSVYFFNGLEDSGAVHGKATYILQPVLSYGKSGCIIDPINFFRWYLISFSVTGDGRAYCGKRIAVEEGERVRGIMQLEDDGTTWSTISIRLKNNDTSAVKTNLANRQPNAAYNTLETMINYKCTAFPESGTITFDRNILRNRKGETIKPQWKATVRHAECKQQVEINADDSVTLKWDATAVSEVVV